MTFEQFRRVALVLHPEFEPEENYSEGWWASELLAHAPLDLAVEALFRLAATCGDGELRGYAGECGYSGDGIESAELVRTLDREAPAAFDAALADLVRAPDLEHAVVDLGARLRIRAGRQSRADARRSRRHV